MNEKIEKKKGAITMYNENDYNKYHVLFNTPSTCFCTFLYIGIVIHKISPTTTANAVIVNTKEIAAL